MPNDYADRRIYRLQVGNEVAIVVAKSPRDATEAAGFTDLRPGVRLIGYAIPEAGRGLLCKTPGP